MREPARGNGESGPAHAGPFEPVLRRIEELAAEAGYLASARVDSLKAKARRTATSAALGALAGAGGAALVVVAVVELVSGIASGLGEWLGARWLGGIVAGVLVLAAIGAGAAWFLRRTKRLQREKTLARYAERKAAQRRRFGHDIAELAHHRGNGGASV